VAGHRFYEGFSQLSHDDIENIGSNTSTNPHIDQIVASRYSRRAVMMGGTATAAVLFYGGSQVLASGAATSDVRPAARRGPRIGFTSVPTSSDDLVTVPEEYTAEVLIPWGTPLFSDVEWKKDASNTAADQEKQVGFNHDGMFYYPLGRGAAGSKRGLLVLNHEYTDANQIYTAEQGSTITPDAAGREKVAKAVAGHGVSVVEVKQNADGSWSEVVDSPYNRRITGTTPVDFTGPVTLDHAALASNNGPMGTLNNCGSGPTPWGTYLACEENWNGYFGTSDTTWTPTTSQRRYGVSAAGFGYSWHVADARWDVALNPNELHRFGWVVEIDPMDPDGKPMKRTALGRFKHESAAVTESRGRAVVYSGDDENLDYIYKFVSARPWKKARARGLSPLDEGTLYVAKFEVDGTGTWLPLAHGTGPLLSANGFADQADVLIRTREAADAVGATPMHRPEWISVDELTSEVYATLTNGSGYTQGRGATEPNPVVNSDRDPNPYGHVLKWREHDGDHTALTFEWEIFVLAGDPVYDEKANGLTGDNIFGSPDGIWLDPDGRVWIQTDISNNSQNSASRGYDNIRNNAMLVADPRTREIKRFLVGPRGCEITGVHTTPDQRTMFVNVQHPGESTSHWNAQFGAPSPDNPRTVSNWPEFDPEGRPRPATVVIRRRNGGVIGS
jgi:secreted PhoX family phosphatase